MHTLSMVVSVMHSYLNKLKANPSSPAAVVAVGWSAPGYRAAGVQYCRVTPVIVSVQCVCVVDKELIK